MLFWKRARYSDDNIKDVFSMVCIPASGYIYIYIYIYIYVIYLLKDMVCIILQLDVINYLLYTLCTHTHRIILYVMRYIFYMMQCMSSRYTAYDMLCMIHCISGCIYKDIFVCH